MAEQASITTAAAAELKSICLSCAKPLSGQFVRALGGTYHLDCFKCKDCSKVVAARFFPLEEGGKTFPLCERDYFRRLQLLCEKCGEALRGSYITAIGKKYHLDHFTCSLCSTVFGPDETYYEHDGNIFCHFHYSIKHAVMCGGCKMPILKQFVEVKTNQNEQWHPECYMIYKSWNIRLASSAESPIQNLTSEEVKHMQQMMEEKSSRIWTVLSAFEESAAACISDMLLHVSNQGYIDAVNEAGNFINHVDVLFLAIDELDAEMVRYGDTIGIAYNKEPKMLSKKIVNFFSLLSHTQDTGVKQYGTVTQELLSLVTSLAQYLKVLIRITLAGALKLERKYNHKTAIGDFLNRLVEMGQRELDSDEANLKFDVKFKLSDIDVKSDLCVKCRMSVEEAAIRFNSFHWHKKCFSCSVCLKDLQTSVPAATFDAVETQVLCPEHTRLGAKSGFESVTQLQQYTFLLRVALKRLYGLLKVKDDSTSVSYSKLPDSLIAASSSDQMIVNDTQMSQMELKTPESQSPGSDLPTEDVVQVPKSIETAAYYGSIHNMIEDTQGGGIDIPVRQSSMLPLGEMSSNMKLSTSLPEFQNSGPVARAKKEVESTWVSNTPEGVTRVSGDRRMMSLAESSALERFTVKHVAVLRLHPLVKEHFQMGELLDLIRTRKTTFWTKILSTLKPSKKPSKVDGVFGVSLELLIERNGVDSKHGRGQVRIPAFVEAALNSLKAQNLKVEGIFRKNGNIKNLHTLQEKIDKDISSVNLAKESCIQIAALLKKFLRDMPEPLLTFKLYKLFIISQRTSKVESRKKILHYCCCLLPKPNRDLLEVLLEFLRYVASFSSGADGNKMDVTNLATVIAPNILYNKPKERLAITTSSGNLKDESFLAIDAVKALILYQDEFWLIPPEIAEVVQSADIQSEDLNKDSKEVLKTLLSTKKSHTSRDVHVGETSQYPAGTAATIVEEGQDKRSRTDIDT